MLSAYPDHRKLACTLYDLNCLCELPLVKSVELPLRIASANYLEQTELNYQSLRHRAMLNYLSCLRVNYVKRLNILEGFPILLKSFLLCSTDNLLTTLYLWLKRGQRLKVSGLKTSFKAPFLTPVAWENGRYLTTFGDATTGFPVVAMSAVFSGYNISFLSQEHQTSPTIM